jgi:hypothetical protein
MRLAAGDQYGLKFPLTPVREPADGWLNVIAVRTGRVDLPAALFRELGLATIDVVKQVLLLKTFG